MDRKRVADLLKKLENSVLPSREDSLEIVGCAKKIIEREPNVLYINDAMNVVGDLHGQYYDFLHLLEIVDPNHGMLFLGDYVDRGYNSVELILYILLMKINADMDENSNNRGRSVFLLRGNHENRAQTSAYGFMSECIAKYDIYLYWKVCELFEYLPVAAIVNNKYFCVHGGISPGLSIAALQNADRVAEYSEIGYVLWGDPSDDIDTFSRSQRGAGYLYGASAVDQFLKSIACEYLLRSHQLVFDGVKEHFGGSCITVWSAPNYCYKCKNMAAVMVIPDEKARAKHSFIYFAAVEEQYRAEDLKMSYFNN